MTSASWSEVERLFDLAVAHDRTERTAFLNHACSDLALRREVESLLEADDRLGLLDRPPASGRNDDVRIGAYRLLHKLGEGETSSVYLAVRDDGQYHQQVAIKLIQPGIHTAQIVERFKQERQILASLNHPHIARLLDGGSTPAGQPFFVMEYVDGQPLDVHCCEHRLSLASRLELFGLVCQAVHFAHRRLVVHRDLKPSNILVDAEGLPRLLDFGIAKLLDPDWLGVRVERTATVARLMTPHYASPEQVQGKPVSFASDVYSLGVILYKLVTGRRPYEIGSPSLHDIERVVCESAPIRPSRMLGARRGDRLHRDLDDVILTALHKEPDLRYASAQTLARDVRRCLERRPLLAPRDTIPSRARAFVRRHRGALIAAVVLSLAAGGVVRNRVQPQRGDPNLVGYWTYNDPCDSRIVADRSGNGADGTKVGGVACTAGHAGLAGAFAGGQVKVPDQSDFHFATAMTVAAWVRPFRSTGPQTLLAKWCRPDSYLLRQEDDSYWFTVVLADGEYVNVTAPAAMNEWAHVVGTFDGSTLALYVNGVLASSRVASGTLQDSDQPIMMGRHPSWNTYNGLLDEVRLYNVALSPGQVRQLAK